MNGLTLVVARGSDEGARLRLDPSDRFIGRARDADLVLADPRVSRRHLRVRANEGEALLETCTGAAPFILDGTPRTIAAIRVGDTVIVGDTALTLAEEQVAAGDTGRTTDVRALMTGLAADVRGLAAAMDLVEALDATSDDAGIRDALGDWAKRHANATGVALSEGDSSGALPRDAQVSEQTDRESGSTRVSVALDGGVLGHITFACVVPGSDVTQTQRRLVVVGARLCISALARVRSLQEAKEEQEAFRRASVGSARSFLGESAGAREVAKLVSRLSASEVTVLIEGETGAGKTFLARLIHESSARAKAPFRVINCAAIPDTLVEAELFGHERGAFTGASTARAGALEAAGEGTVLLDEIGELPLASQAKLLRVLEERRFERVGSNRGIALKARVIVATNRDLQEMVDAGTFRGDLYFRIAVLKLRVPPLRERGDDLLLLAERMLSDLAPSAGRRVKGFSPAAREAIRRYPWPGNVRELRNAIERALVVGDGALITPADLPESVTAGSPPQPSDASLVRLPARLDWLEERAIEAALRATAGNQVRAAVLLGINRVTLNRKLRGRSESS